MNNVLKKALVGFFALSAVFEVYNSLPPTPEKSIANSLPPTMDAPVRIANSLPPCIESRCDRIANSLPPTMDAPVRIANSLPPVAEYAKVRTYC